MANLFIIYPISIWECQIYLPLQLNVIWSMKYLQTPEFSHILLVVACMFTNVFISYITLPLPSGTVPLFIRQWYDWLAVFSLAVAKTT